MTELKYVSTNYTHICR